MPTTIERHIIPSNEPGPAPFSISAVSSLQERPPRTLKNGDTFGVFDHHGDALARPGGAAGLYHRDTRHLSHLALTVEGLRPILLSSTLRDNNAALTCDLTCPDIYTDAGEVWLRHDLVHVRRTRFLWEGACHERLALRNFDHQTRRLRIGIAFAADFADLFEVRGTRRKRRGRLDPPVIGKDKVTLSYLGLDGKRRETHLRFDPVPDRLTGNAASFDLELEPRQRTVLFFETRFGAAEPEDRPARTFFLDMGRSRRALRQTSARAAAISTSNDLFNELVRRSVSDIYTLVTDTPYGPYPYAGIPWFSTVFGRDALITALETLWLDPAIARGVLGYLAANQATSFDASADAEPGKILHEERHGEMADLGEVPFGRYYGSVDSTPLFIMLAGAYLERTADVETLSRIWPNIQAALRWIDESGDKDGDGFVEYGRQTSEGLANQGWKDSDDSIFHADGKRARGPIAVAEVQGYVYGAWRAASTIARALGQKRAASELETRAEALRERFDAAFFDEGMGTYALALDGDKQPCRVRSSNAGHALFTGIAYPERAATLARTLMAGPSFSGWGIRTIATTEARYNPMSYHNGSVWPHDNAMIAAGLAAYGRRQEAARILEGLFAASTYIELRRLPELFCGFTRPAGQGPTFYPVACTPQAWAAAAPLSLLQSCLGLGFDPANKRVNFDEPILPDILDEVVLRHLTIGPDFADVALRRSGGKVVVDVLARTGPVRVVTTS